MYLHGIASAFPEFAFTQLDCWEGLQSDPTTEALRSSSRRMLEKVLTGDSGIDKRHFCLPNPLEVFARDAGALNAEFESNAPQLAKESLAKAMEETRQKPSDIDAIFVCTCTGYICPGVSSHLAQSLGLRQDAYLQDLVGLGCGAAIPTLHSAANFISAHPATTVAVVAVEVCSAAFYMDDDPGVLISLCLFGDGASASIWKGCPPAIGAAYQISNFQTVHKPEEREKIRFVNDLGKLKNQLHRSVPKMASDTVRDLYQANHNGDIDCILAHPGGRDVIEAVENGLGCGELEESRAVLREFGNLSSPSVLVALEKRLQKPAPGDRLWLTAFGAGFACHGADLTRTA